VVASRKASQMAIEAYAPHLPELIGGSADLAHSNLTLWTGSKSVAGTIRTRTTSTTACASSA
jgi:transketolase